MLLTVCVCVCVCVCVKLLVSKARSSSSVLLYLQRDCYNVRDGHVLPNNRTPFTHILVGVNRSSNPMPKRDHCSEDTKISEVSSEH